jgi:hypothetical protein
MEKRRKAEKLFYIEQLFTPGAGILLSFPTCKNRKHHKKTILPFYGYGERRLLWIVF